MKNSYRATEQGERDRCEDYGLTYDLVEAQPRLVTKSSVQTASHLEELASTIESAIIPRLLMSHGLERPMNDLSPIAGFDAAADDVEIFARLTIGPDNRESFEFIESRLARGHAVEDILLNLMAPAARLMGDMWMADQCSFVDVTLGLTRIQQMLRQLRGLNDGSRVAAENRGTALLVPAPGEQHTFGLRVVEEFLLRDGWEVRSNLRATLDDIISVVSQEHYDFVGFSLSGERLLPELRSAIVKVRKTSQNRSVRIMVGGVVFVGRPEVMRLVDADATIEDARQAVSVANGWYSPVLMN